MNNPAVHLFAMTLPETDAGRALRTALICIDRGDISQARGLVVHAIAQSGWGLDFDHIGDAAGCTILAIIDRDIDSLGTAVNRWRRQYAGLWRFNEAVATYLLAAATARANRAEALALLSRCVSLIDEYKAKNVYALSEMDRKRADELLADVYRAKAELTPRISLPMDAPELGAGE